MAVTSPDNLWSPDSTDAYNLTVDLAAMQDSVQDALDGINSVVSRLPRAMASGTELVVSPTANTVASQAVSFPPGRFNSSPAVTVTGNSAVPGTIFMGATVTGVSSSGFTINLFRTNPTTTSVHWIAVED